MLNLYAQIVSQAVHIMLLELAMHRAVSVIAVLLILIPTVALAQEEEEKKKQDRKKERVIELVEMMGHKDSQVRYGAVQELGEIRDVRAIEALIKALKDESSVVRYFAALGLGNVGDNKAVKPLRLSLLANRLPGHRRPRTFLFQSEPRKENGETYDRSHSRRRNAKHQEELCCCPGAARGRSGIAPQ